MMKNSHRQIHPQYRDSGIKWLGNIPEHWNVRRLKYLTSINDEVLSETTEPDHEFNYVDIGNVDATVGIAAKENYRFENAPSRTRRIVRAGDTIVSTVRTYLRAIVPIHDLEDRLIVSTGFAVVRPRVIEPSYLSYALRSPFFVEKVVSLSTGVSYPAINASDIGTIEITVPPSEEQHSIVNFLDEKTAKVDALVEKKQRLIELLKEKRTALISQAVTKGLDPNAKMKDSGVEWLGEVPEGWEILKGSLIGRLFGSEQVPDESVCDEGDLPFIKVGSMSLDSFEIESWDWFVDRSVADQYKSRSSYIVFPKRGAAIFMNKVNIVERPSLIDPNLMGWKIGEKAVPKFIAYTLKLRKLEEIADVSTVPQINNKHIAPEFFPVPPLGEQKEIVTYIDSEAAKIKALIEKVRIAIDKLKEYRTALISAAVTGKIDVRGFASREVICQ